MGALAVKETSLSSLPAPPYCSSGPALAMAESSSGDWELLPWYWGEKRKKLGSGVAPGGLVDVWGEDRPTAEGMCPGEVLHC